MYFGKNAVDTASKLQIALLRRAPFTFDRMYVPSFGQVVERPGRISSVFQEIFIRQIYRPLVPLPVAPTIVDLGAHMGTFTMWSSLRTRNASYHCMEANPPTFALLEKNLGRAGKRNRFILHNVAVSGEDGWLEFNADQSNPENLSNSAFNDLSNVPDTAGFSRVRVPAKRLDQLVAGRIDFLKCDVEGAEYGVLEPSLLQSGRVAQLAAEFHQTDRNRDAFDAILDQLFRANYRIFTDTGSVLPSRTDVHAYREAKGRTLVLKACAAALLDN